MDYKFIIAALTVMAFTACSEGRKTPDGYEMDNPPPSAYAPSDYETFDQKNYEPASANNDTTIEVEVVEEDAADDKVDDVVGEAEDDGVEETEEADDTVDEEEE